MSEEENKEIIEYGMYRLKIYLVSIIVILALGYIMKMFIQSACFLVSFLPLRCYAGGYHAKTQKACSIISFLILYITFAIFRGFDNSSKSIVLFIDMVCSLAVWQWAPVDNLNKRLDSEEIRKYRICTRKILLIESAILVILYGTDISKMFFGSSISIWIVGFVVVVGNMERLNEKYF